MEGAQSDFVIRVIRSPAGWRWQVLPAGAGPVSGAAPELESAWRAAAFAAAIVQSLDRARRRNA